MDSITTQSGDNTQTLMQLAEYLPFGPAKSFTYGNGLTHTQTYDLDYRLTSIQVGGILNRSYGYDYANNITGIVNNLNSNQSQAFNYDELDRLTTALGNYGNLVYTYDAVGNRLTETRNGATDSYQYETTSNRLRNISGNTPRNFVYDSAGNPIQRTSENGTEQTFVYNNANRLSSVSTNSTIIATYSYNPLGQRTTKTVNGNIQEQYHYDEAGQLIAVTDGAGATIREYIYWGNQLISFVANGNIYYVHTDHLNTPQVVTNQAQQIVWAASYEPFGKVNLLTNTVEIYSRFPGQISDTETGLYYNWHRYFDPTIGRYIESDRIGLAGGINTYAYVLNNPLKYVDPNGLLSLSPTTILEINPVIRAGRTGWQVGGAVNSSLDLMGVHLGTTAYEAIYGDEWAAMNEAANENDDTKPTSDAGETCPVPPPNKPPMDCDDAFYECQDEIGINFWGNTPPQVYDRLMNECMKRKAPHCI